MAALNRPADFRTSSNLKDLKKRFEQSASAAPVLRTPSQTTEKVQDDRVRYKLHGITEQRVLKAGLLKLQKVLAGKFSSQELSELPRRRDGSQLIMTPSFYQRLIRNELELKTMLDGDVSAAQSDVKHLRLEQLLTIRAGCLDWATECEMKSAHINFLYSVDTHLFERLASQLLQWSLDPPPKAAVLHALGLRLALTVGAVEVIESGWGGSGFPEHFPQFWALGLNAEDWSGCSAAVFNSSQLFVELIGGPGTTFEAIVEGSQIAVATDRSTGVGKDRILHWEIALLDPTENVLLELHRKEDVAKKKMSDELSDVLKKRMSGRSAILGLPSNAEAKVESHNVSLESLAAPQLAPAVVVRQPKTAVPEQPTPAAVVPEQPKLAALAPEQPKQVQKQDLEMTPERPKASLPEATPSPPPKPEVKVEAEVPVKAEKELVLDGKTSRQTSEQGKTRKATFLGTVLPDCITDVLECGGNRRD